MATTPPQVSNKPMVIAGPPHIVGPVRPATGMVYAGPGGFKPAPVPTPAPKPIVGPIRPTPAPSPIKPFGGVVYAGPPKPISGVVYAGPGVFKNVTAAINATKSSGLSNVTAAVNATRKL